MEISPLVRPLARLFTYLFYGQLLLYPFIIPLYIVLMRTVITSHSSAPLNRWSNRVDTVLVNGRRMVVERLDTTRENYIATNPAALTLASVSAVDSTFRINFNADFAVTRDGYFVQRSTPKSAYILTLPLGYRVIDIALNANPDPTKRYALPRASGDWHHRLQFGPTIQIAEPIGQRDDTLSITITSWQDVVAIPVGLKVALLLLLLPAVFVLLVTYQFMQLFKSLSQEDVFSERQLRRVRTIGYYALSYVALRFCALIVVSKLASWYIKTAGVVNLDSITQWGLPAVEWSWLLMGLCILVLVQVFKYGMQLKQENELTI